MSTPTSPIAPPTSPFSPAFLSPHRASNTNGMIARYPSSSTFSSASSSEETDSDLEPLDLKYCTSNTALGKRKRGNNQQLLSTAQHLNIHLADRCMPCTISCTTTATLPQSCCEYRTCWRQYLGKPISYFDGNGKWPKDWTENMSHTGFLVRELLAGWPQFKPTKPRYNLNFPPFAVQAPGLIDKWLNILTKPTDRAETEVCRTIQEVGLSDYFKATFVVEDSNALYRVTGAITGPRDLDEALRPYRNALREARLAKMEAMAEHNRQMALKSARRHAAYAVWAEKQAENDPRAWFQYWVNEENGERDCDGIRYAKEAYFDMVETAAKHGWKRAEKEWYASDAAPPKEEGGKINTTVEEQRSLTVEDQFKVLRRASEAGCEALVKRERKQSKRALESDESLQASGSPRKRARR